MTDDKEHPLLNRQIVYTGITRAKERAMVTTCRRGKGNVVYCNW